MNNYWKKCVEFHGHECGGLTIGYKAALFAIELLELKFSENEEVVCISENDACGIDAIQVILGCSAGKGNLLFHLTGKSAYSFYNRNTKKSIRIVLKDRPKNITKEESFIYLQSKEPRKLFDIKETTIELPEKAIIFNSYHCDGCGEMTSENMIHLQNGEKLCSDCYVPYNRFDI